MSSHRKATPPSSAGTREGPRLPGSSPLFWGLFGKLGWTANSGSRPGQHTLQNHPGNQPITLRVRLAMDPIVQMEKLSPELKEMIP